MSRFFLSELFGFSFLVGKEHIKILELEEFSEVDEILSSFLAFKSVTGPCRNSFKLMLSLFFTVLW